MTVFYSDTYTIPLPDGHKFPMAKYRMIRDELLHQGILSPEELRESPIFPAQELTLAHDEQYVSDVCNLTLDPKIVRRIGFPLTEGLAAHLIIEVDGNDKDVLMKDMEAIADVLSNFEVGELYFADDAQQKTELWKIRRKANEASVAAGYTIEEDTVVPRAELPKLIKGVKALAAENGFKVVSYGHAGDGNLHVRINHPLYKKSYENEVIQDILFKIFELVKSLGGTISGEHGIGLIQKSFMPVMFDPITMELMKGIKKVFDPNHILNAGKIFDSK